MLKIHLIFKKDYLTSSLTLMQWNSFTIIQGALMQGVAPIARLLILFTHLLLLKRFTIMYCISFIYIKL